MRSKASRVYSGTQLHPSHDHSGIGLRSIYRAYGILEDSTWCPRIQHGICKFLSPYHNRHSWSRLPSHHWKQCQMGMPSLHIRLHSTRHNSRTTDSLGSSHRARSTWDSRTPCPHDQACTRTSHSRIGQRKSTALIDLLSQARYRPHQCREGTSKDRRIHPASRPRTCKCQT